MATEHAVLGGVLKGRFAVDEIVGEGAFGRVYRARDLETDRVVALKEFVRERGRPDSFLRELGILFDLSHPSVVACESVVMSGPFRYLVCEYMDGGSLRGLLHERASVGVLLPLFRTVLQAVAFAHGRGVIHRDLKPENILLTRRDGPLRAKVADFGISTLGGEFGSRSAIGSPAYMAPEQFSDQYDHRVDLYALGIILYEILHGRRPFAGSPAQLMAAHLRKEAPIALWLPRPLQRLLRGLLAKRIDRRIATAADALLAFDRALPGLAGGKDGGPRAGWDAFAQPAWPIVGRGALRGLAHTREEVWILDDQGLRRHDREGRLLAESERCDGLYGRGSFIALRRGRAVEVDLGGLRRTVAELSPDGSLALGYHGAVAVVDGGGVLVATGARQDVVVATGGGATAAQFFGRDQNLVWARGGPAPRLVLPRGELELPEEISAIYAHDDRRELVLRAARDPDRLLLVHDGRLTAVTVACGPLTSDGEAFFAATPSGELVSIHVPSSRVARTRWERPLTHVSASDDRLLFGTEEGAVVAA